MSEQNNIGNNKRIAKNTLFLYFRMILIMGVTLYTSRVILDKLGIEDYGLYQVVGSVVGMVSFLKGTLSAGTSRFITFELGVNNLDRLKRTFSTTFYTHVILGIIIVILMETGGLWFLYNKLQIPTERLTACFWVFQLSIITAFVATTQIPYSSAIMAHEKMGIYAYISIFEAFAKLGVCYLITMTTTDRLVIYAILIATVQFLVAMFYRVYCVRKFTECHITRVYDRLIFRNLIGFTGWNVMANLAETLKLQGVLVLINLFFSPVVVAAQAVANQVTNAMMQFVSNFRTAINPQIIKLYASGDKDESKKLTLRTTVYSFELMLILGLPAIIVMDWLMHIWLVEVPDYAVVFTQWIIIRQIIGVFSAAFYTPMMAANKLKLNSTFAVFSGIGQFILLYILFRCGLGPMWIQYTGLIVTLLYSMGVKPYVLYKDIDYTIKELLLCYWNCLKVLLLSCVIICPAVYLLDEGGTDNIFKIIVSIISVAISSYVFLEQSEKNNLKYFVMKKIKNLR